MNDVLITIGRCLLHQIHYLYRFHSGLALITMKEALLWTDGRYFLQATKELSDQWKLMRIGEDPAVDVWLADVSYYLFKIIYELFLEVKLLIIFPVQIDKNVNF